MSAPCEKSKSIVGHVLAWGAVLSGALILISVWYAAGGRPLGLGPAADSDPVEFVALVLAVGSRAAIVSALSFITVVFLKRVFARSAVARWFWISALPLVVLCTLLVSMVRAVGLWGVIVVLWSAFIYYLVYWGIVALSDATLGRLWRISRALGAGFIGIVMVGSGWLAYESGHLGGEPARKLQLQTRLFVKIWSNDPKGVATCLAEGADPNGHSTQLNHPTPLIDAGRMGFVEVVQLLLDNKADPNKPDRYGHGPLWYVFANPLGDVNGKGSPEIVQLLLERGADPLGKDVIAVASNLPSEDQVVVILQEALAKAKPRTSQAP